MAGLVPAIPTSLACARSIGITGTGPVMTVESFLRNVEWRLDYASPAVSNIAALIASCADFPAQTTNCNAG